jgi:hypothetical protein
MDMLCVAAQHDPIGYLGTLETLITSGTAQVAAVSEAEFRSAMAELERKGVCSRDRHGRIYSRRMVRDAQRRAVARKNGGKGGNPRLSKQRTISPPDKGEVKAEVNPQYQSPYSNKPVVSTARAPLLTACEAMGVDLEALRLKPSWMMFGDFYLDLVGQGCLPERDIWPTIARLKARHRRVPTSPLYFKTAILQSRDAHAVEATVSPQEVAERLALFAREGVWSSKWGPRPDEVSP